MNVRLVYRVKTVKKKDLKDPHSSAQYIGIISEKMSKKKNFGKKKKARSPFYIKAHFLSIY